MTHDERKRVIEEIVGPLPCSHNFRCIEDEGFCQTEGFGLKEYLECVSSQYPRDCQFRIRFGDGVLCKCPLRLYIHNELKGKADPLRILVGA